METLADAIGLRMAGFGLGVVDIFDSQVQLVLVVFYRPAELSATIRQDP